MNDPVIRIPPRLRDVPLLDVPLPRRAQDALLRAGVLWVGDLHERPLGWLLRTPRIGRVRASEIVRALADLEARSRDARPPARASWAGLHLAALGFGRWAVSAVVTRGPVTLGDLHAAPEVLFLDGPALGRVLQRLLREGVPDAAPAGWFRDAVFAPAGGPELLAIPHEIRDLPLATADVGLPTVGRLERAGIERLGDLDGAAAGDLAWFAGLAPRSAVRVGRAVARLLAIAPPAELGAAWSRTGGGRRALPMEVHYRVARATTLEDEVRALAADLPPRNAAIVLARWQVDRDAPATLSALAARHGISRERARQIVGRVEARLAHSRLRLPIATHIAEQIHAAGRPLDTAELLLLLERSGVRARPASLRFLPRLAGLDLVPPVDYIPEQDLWAVPEEAALALWNTVHPLPDI